jgi:hypothetical protein
MSNTKGDLFSATKAATLLVSLSESLQPATSVDIVLPRLSTNYNDGHITDSLFDGPWFDQHGNPTDTPQRFALTIFKSIDARYALKDKYIDDGKFLLFHLMVFDATASLSLLFNDHDFTKKYREIAKIPRLKYQHHVLRQWVPKVKYR